MITTDRAPLAFYYGAGHLDALSAYERVVLQPDSYATGELQALRARGVSTLAYLCLSEDTGPPAPWHRPVRNPDWGGAMVHIGDPRWVEHVLGQARRALAAGFDGLFLDQLNIEFTFPADLPHLLDLVAGLRKEVGTRYMLANRGFALLPRLADLVDGILFESFSVRWVEAGYDRWPEEMLAEHDVMAEQLLRFPIDRFALDYADGGPLAEFAAGRAHWFGMHSVISDKALSRI